MGCGGVKHTSPPFCRNCNLRHAIPGRDVCDTCEAALKVPVRPKPTPPATETPAAVMTITTTPTARPIEPIPYRTPRYEPGGYLHFLIRRVRSLRRLHTALATAPGVTALPAPGFPEHSGGNRWGRDQSTAGLDVLQRSSPVASTLPRPTTLNDSSPQPCSAVGAARKAGQRA
jgi:hypothetical protein